MTDCRMQGAGRYLEVRRVLLLVLVLNWLVALAKVALGIISRSASMTADGLHSFSDGVSNIIGLAGIFFASRPKDEDHPYGHKKFETFFSLGIAFLLGLVCVELLQKGVERLIHPVVPEVSWLSFAVMSGTLLVNVAVMCYERSKGLALHSDLLLSDAMHTRADIFTSLSVIASLFAVRLGWPVLDALTTLLISLFIGYAAYEIVLDSARVLCDEAVIKDISRIEKIALAVPGACSCHKIRSRGRGDDIHLDLHVQMSANLSLDKAHQIGHEIERAIKLQITEVTDVIVHIEPARDSFKHQGVPA